MSQDVERLRSIMLLAEELLSVAGADGSGLLPAQRELIARADEILDEALSMEDDR